MINEKQLAELNKMECSEHKETPKAEYQGEEFNFKCCCANFDKQIREFVRKKTLKNLQEITRKGLGLK